MHPARSPKDARKLAPFSQTACYLTLAQGRDCPPVRSHFPMDTGGMAGGPAARSMAAGRAESHSQGRMVQLMVSM